jgi:GR25 family glycosyltransferase involved in LPS biosynthesis
MKFSPRFTNNLFVSSFSTSFSISFSILFTVLFAFLFAVFLFIFVYYSSSIISYSKEGFDSKRPSVHKIIDAIYYINLDKREDRKQEFLDNFNEIDEKRIIKIRAHHYPDNGAAGCLMSHITALSKAMSDNKGENILICEDDFMIKDMNYFNKMLDLLYEKIPEWHVIMLGHNTVDSKDTGIETKEHEKIIRILNSQTTSGYLIKRSYISTLLDIYAKDLTEYMKTGEWGNYYTDQSWKILQPVDDWYAFEPSVGFQRPSYSDIQNGFISVEV